MLILFLSDIAVLVTRDCVYESFDTVSARGNTFGSFDRTLASVHLKSDLDDKNNLQIS